MTIRTWFVGACVLLAIAGRTALSAQAGGGAQAPFGVVAYPPRAPGEPAYTRWFNTTAFAAQPINTIGDSVVPRNFLHGPSQRRLDLSLFKDVTLPRGARLQLRVEAYNVTNAVNFANPNGALGNPAFGTITGTNGTPRQMQFAAKLLF